MRPVRRDKSPQNDDFFPYGDAKPFLISRLGSYCSFCERHIVTNLAVEHIQPKALGKYAHLIGRWDNFLLACVNCNSTKGDKDVDPAEVLLPDRDNTFASFLYGADGVVDVQPGLQPTVAAMATRTLDLVGLNAAKHSVDENDEAVALDRVSQRRQAWLTADHAKGRLTAQPGNHALQTMAVELASATGFFSIWMTVFKDDGDMRRRLIDAFSGTEPSGCFDPNTTAPVSPAPNLDRLPHGGKL